MNLRDLERGSIRNFVQHCADAGIFSDKDVLDYGCGQQPYRDLIVAGRGRYHGFDDPSFPGSTVTEPEGNPLDFGPYGAILCTQVVQYIADVPGMLRVLLETLSDEGGSLVITWPTNWPEVEVEDLHRFTQSGMARLLYSAGFETVDVTPRAFLEAGGSKFFLGYGAIAWKK